MKMDIWKIMRKCEREAPFKNCIYCKCNRVECAEHITELIRAEYLEESDNEQS